MGENGPVVMAVCCLLWLMDSETAITEIDGELHVEAVSYARGCFFMAVQAIRLVIASTLLVAGQFFLMNTTSIGDMLLNAVALQFVMDIDETCYKTLSPTNLKKLVAEVQPIPLPRSRSFN